MLDLFHPALTGRERELTDEAPAVVIRVRADGQGMVARAMHFNGPRRDRPFVSENWPAI